MSNAVTITDVTLREYGQNVPSAGLSVFTPEIRVSIVRGLIRAGFRDLEIFSCVSPAVAPAMNLRALELIATSLGRIEGVHLITLVPNWAGYENFLSLGLGPEGFNHTLGLFFSAVEEHNLANLGKAIEESQEIYGKILKDASKRGIRTMGYVSAAFGYRDPEKGLLRPTVKTVSDFIDFFLGHKVQAVVLSDLQGVADPSETQRLLEVLLKGGVDSQRLGYHPHHVIGERAVANSLAAYEAGIRRFDASLSGTGGCVTGAPGNQPTELLIRFFHEKGITTGIDEAKVLAMAERVRQEVYGMMKEERK